MVGKTSDHSRFAEYSAEARSMRLFCRLRLFSMPRSTTSSRERVKAEVFCGCTAYTENRNTRKKQPSRKHLPLKV
jgi:hypothetical protein